MKISKMGLYLMICFLILVSINNGLVGAARVFKVGDELGWQEPGVNNNEVYDLWASRNRFQVGDSLSFEYSNDSVIEVDKKGYYHCNGSNPIAAFDNGKGIFKLERPGPFYYISGAPNHCRNGQRLLVEVMGLHHYVYSPPSIANPPEYSYQAPSPQPSSGELVLVKNGYVLIVLVAAFAALVWSAP